VKIIHTADLHLESKMNANLDQTNAKLRRAEMLHTFTRMVDYAATHEVEAILIAGDLFDTSHISKTAQNTVLTSIVSHPEIDFYYLKGNHDKNDFLQEEEELPQNLKTFSATWTKYALSDQVVLSGLELNPENVVTAASSLHLNFDQINLVMLHGQEARTAPKKGAEIIDTRAFAGKGIDYMALGHIHARKEEKLDGRGIYVYPGCLEGRGFDETGEHGFIELDIDEEKKTISHRFVPFAFRTVYELPVNLSDVTTSLEVRDAIRVALAGNPIPSASLVKIVLTGYLPVEAEIDVDFLTKELEESFFFLKVQDDTKEKIDFESFRNDISLKGEFVRQVEADTTLSEEEKARIIKAGFQALKVEV